QLRYRVLFRGVLSLVDFQQPGQFVLALPVPGSGQTGPDGRCLGHCIGDPPLLDQAVSAALHQQLDGGQILRLGDESTTEPVVTHDRIPGAGQKLVPPCSARCNAVTRQRYEDPWVTAVVGKQLATDDYVVP